MEIKKGQSSLEFIILIGAVLFFVTGFIFAVQNNIYEKNEERRDITLREVAITIQDEINLASESRDGYFRSFDLPNTILGLDYLASLDIWSVYVRTDDGAHALSLPIQEVIGELGFGENKITKTDGKICINVDQNICLSCGNGIKESSEECDGGDFGFLFPQCINSDPSYNHGDPPICSANCKIDYSVCSVCGNTIIDGNEICDGNSESCSINGGGGEKNCLPSCDAFGSCVPFVGFGN